MAPDDEKMHESPEKWFRFSGTFREWKKRYERKDLETRVHSDTF